MSENVRMPGPLPVVFRFENDSSGPKIAFTCLCGEAVSTYAAIEGCAAEARCPKCGVFIQIHASRSYEAEGGKPGTGRGHF